MLRKMLFGVVMCICLGLCASALALQPTLKIEGTTVTGIENVKYHNEVKELIIPQGITAITADLGQYRELSYIKFEAADVSEIPSVNLSNNIHLKALFFNFDLTTSRIHVIQQKISPPDGVEFLQFVDIGSKYFNADDPVYDASSHTVSIQYDHIAHHAWYMVERDAEVFDSRRDFSNFALSSGTWTFTDVSIPVSTQPQTYTYSITVHAPCSTSVISSYVRSVDVPPAIIPPAPSVPATGDDVPLFALSLLMACSAAMCLFCAERIKTRKS